MKCGSVPPWIGPIGLSRGGRRSRPFFSALLRRKIRRLRWAGLNSAKETFPRQSVPNEPGTRKGQGFRSGVARPSYPAARHPGPPRMGERKNLDGVVTVQLHRNGEGCVPLRMAHPTTRLDPDRIRTAVRITCIECTARHAPHWLGHPA